MIDLCFPIQLQANCYQNEKSHTVINLFAFFNDGRSHSFAIREKTEGMDCYDSGTIYNLNVRGKRGNIVQTYPGVEYDFVPNRLTVAEGDCIHIQ